MKNKLTKIVLCLLVASIMMIIGLTASAAVEGETSRDLTVKGITVTVGGNTISDAYSDPADYWEVATSGSLTDYEIRYDTVNATDTVIYTAWYPDITTKRTGDVTEFVCKFEGGKYVVTEVNTNGDGSTYIPVGGFVVSVSNSVHPNFAKVGDTVTLGGAEIIIPTKAVESSSGRRVVVDTTNANRSGPMVVYYDYQFGEKTGTNEFVTEIICQFDFEKNTFVVIDFRPFGMGDQSGSVIPDNGFVLSAYGNGYRQLLVRGEIFSVGDEVKMVGFDFIRFGGTVYGEFDYVNPSKETNPGAMETPTEEFPAFRGTDQTIIYEYGWQYKESAGTGTNVYGYEAAVDANGVVVELGVNVSKIPEGGYVISGHGKGRDFIRSNMVLGATIVLNKENKTYSITTTLNSYYENLVTEVENVIETAKTRIKQLYDVDSELLNGYISKATTELENLKAVKEDIEAALEGNITEQERLTLLMQYNNSQLVIEQLRQQILVSSAESYAVSSRAVWHRPYEVRYQEIEDNIRMYKEIGINLIFVETLYNGYSTFNSSYSSLFPYHKNLSKSYVDGEVEYEDYLSAFLACCNEYGIEVHAWVENFYVGLDASAPIVANNPDWVMYNDDGSIIQRNEGGAYIFLDPANKEVQDTLIGYYNELIGKYPSIKGLNLDYIRYPVSNRDEDTGFSVEAMLGFYEKMGWSFTSAQLKGRDKMAKALLNKFNKLYTGGKQEVADANYAAWVEYRTNVITEYVRRIKTEVKEANKIMLSTAVFASDSSNSKKQDWQTWFNNGWIDIATPMAYYNDSTDVLARVNEMILMGGNNCMYYTGIASSYSGLPAWQNKEHIEASYLAGASGYVVFCSTQIIGHNDVQNALVSGVNSKSAILPHAAITDVLSAAFADILDKADRIYIPAEGMTEYQKEQLAYVFTEITGMPCETAEDIYEISYLLSELTKTANIKAYAKGYSRQRIIESLKYVAEILDARASMQLIEDKEWNPETTPVRPEFDVSGAELPVPPECTDHTDEDNNQLCDRCGARVESSDSGNQGGSDSGNQGGSDSGNQGGSDSGNQGGSDSGNQGGNDSGNQGGSDSGDQSDDDGEELGFFAKIWQAILNFFKKLFGIKE